MNNTIEHTEQMNKCFEWIKSCINSCNDNFQLECCRTLMQLFEIRFEESAWQLNRELLQVISDKETTITIF